MRTSNILDPIHHELSPLVWDQPASDQPILKTVHGHWIKSQVYKTLSDGGYTDVEKWLTLVFTGSLTTYQYSADSDVDISLFVDTKVFPEWSRAEMIALMVEKLDGVLLPGTPFPLQDFVVGEGIKPSDLYKPGLRSGYNIDNGKWIVPPERSRVHDVKAEQGGFWAWALQMADKMERLLKYEPDQAIEFWHSIHRKRRLDMAKGKGDFSESNIIYKMLANRGLFPQISQVSGEYIAGTEKPIHVVRRTMRRDGFSQQEIEDFEGYLAAHNEADRDSGELEDCNDEEVERWYENWESDGMPHTASAPTEPPNLRPKEKSDKHCSNCKMYWKASGGKGKCWGYGEHVVSADQVCDSWTADKRPAKLGGPGGRQVAKFVYDPHANHILVGRMGREEGEQPTHSQLMEHGSQQWLWEDPTQLLFGQVGANGYGEIFGRPRLAPGKGGMNPYQAQYMGEEAARRAVPGTKFTNPTKLLKPEWELSEDPGITYMGDPPAVSPDGAPEKSWNFQAHVDVGQISQRIYEKALEGVGSTINLHGESPSTRFGFAPDLATQTPFPLETFSPADVEAFIARFGDRLREPDKFVGSWIQGDEVIMDVTEGSDDYQTAYSRAWNGHQKSLWDSQINDEIPVRGLDYEQPSTS